MRGFCSSSYDPWDRAHAFRATLFSGAFSIGSYWLSSKPKSANVFFILRRQRRWTSSVRLRIWQEQTAREQMQLALYFRRNGAHRIGAARIIVGEIARFLRVAR